MITVESHILRDLRAVHELLQDAVILRDAGDPSSRSTECLALERLERVIRELELHDTR